MRGEEAVGRGGWQRVGDEIVAGIHHALNNRVGALSAVAQVLTSEMEAGHPLRAALASEVERLQETVGALTLLPLRDDAPPEPVMLSDLLPRVVELYGYHHAVRDTPCRVEGAGSVLPVWAEPTGLAHLLAAAAVSAGEAARQAGVEVRVRCSGDEARVEVVVEAPGARYDAEGAVAGLAAPAHALGGSAVAEEGGGVVLRLPTLLEARRREREG